MTHWKRLFLLLLLLGAAPEMAVAQDTSAPDNNAAAREAARTRFERGTAFLEAKNFGAALAEFEAAYRLTKNFKVLWNVAVCQKNLFRYADALETLEKYLKEGGDQIPAQRRSLAEREIQTVRGLMAEVTIKGPEGTAISVDAREVGKLPLQEPVLLGPGTHQVRGSLEGHEDRDLTVRVVSGEKKTVELKLRKLIQDAKLTVTTSPKGALLTIDGKSVGKTPWSGALKPGGHRVRAVLKGFATVDQEVVLTSGQVRPLSLRMRQRDEPTPFFKRWYVWAGIGALAAAGGATYFILNQDEPDVTIAFPE